jgi:hypothetical protein
VKLGADDLRRVAAGDYETPSANIQTGKKKIRNPLSLSQVDCLHYTLVLHASSANGGR